MTETRERAAPARLIAAAICAVAVFLALGAFVSSRAPTPLDAGAAAFFLGQATPLAVTLSEGGLFPAYAAFGVATLVFGLLRRQFLPRAVVAVVTLIVAWLTSDVFKVLFHRARPAHWFWIHELSWSYPSGHAVNAITFWGIWAAALIASRPSPWRTLALVAVVLWTLGIGWSRMALGAHYLSDVVGGYLFGATLVLLALVALRRLAPAQETAA